MNAILARYLAFLFAIYVAFLVFLFALPDCKKQETTVTKGLHFTYGKQWRV